MGHRIECKSMRAKMRSYATGNFVLVSVNLPNDCQISGRTRRINSMERGIERYGIGPSTDIQGRNNLMFFQIKYHELGISRACREQAATLGINSHSSRFLASCERPFTDNRSEC